MHSNNNNEESFEEDLEFFTFKVKRLNMRGIIVPFPPGIWDTFVTRGIAFCWPYVLAGSNTVSEFIERRTVCKEWNEIIKKTKEIWRDPFVRTLRGFDVEQTIGVQLDEEAPVLRKEGVNWPRIVKEAFTKPFVEVQHGVYHENKIGITEDVFTAMRTYRFGGGVIEWKFFKPHVIWALLYKKTLPLFLHKIAVILAVAQKNFEVGTNISKLLWDFHYEKKEKERIKQWGTISVDGIGKASLATQNLIESCKSPPYGISIPKNIRDVIEKKLVEHLYPEPCEDNPGFN